MDINMINSKIAKALEHEKQYGTAADSLRSLAAINGKNISQPEVDLILNFVREYVEHVPYYLEECQKIGKQHGIHETHDVLETLSSYWALEKDLIPDNYGLIGIMDDAYCSLCMLEALSDKYMKERGVPLLPVDLRPANHSMRVLIGESMAVQLDSYVARALGTPDMTTAVENFLEGLMAQPPIFSGPDPYWSDLSLDDYVNVQMGAVGVL